MLRESCFWHVFLQEDESGLTRASMSASRMRISGSALLMASVQEQQERERALAKKAKRRDRLKKETKSTRKRTNMPLTQAEIARVQQVRSNIC